MSNPKLVVTLEHSAKLALFQVLELVCMIYSPQDHSPYSRQISQGTAYVTTTVYAKFHYCRFQGNTKGHGQSEPFACKQVLLQLQPACPELSVEDGPHMHLHRDHLLADVGRNGKNPII